MRKWFRDRRRGPIEPIGQVGMEVIRHGQMVLLKMSMGLCIGITPKQAREIAVRMFATAYTIDGLDGPDDDD